MEWSQLAVHTSASESHCTADTPSLCADSVIRGTCAWQTKRCGMTQQVVILGLAILVLWKQRQSCTCVTLHQGCRPSHVYPSRYLCAIAFHLFLGWNFLWIAVTFVFTFCNHYKYFKCMKDYLSVIWGDKGSWRESRINMQYSLTQNLLADQIFNVLSQEPLQN